MALFHLSCPRFQCQGNGRWVAGRLEFCLSVVGSRSESESRVAQLRQCGSIEFSGKVCGAGLWSMLSRGEAQSVFERAGVIQGFEAALSSSGRTFCDVVMAAG